MTSSFPEVADASPSRRGGRILSIDDDAAIRQFLSAVLKADGYEVLLAADGAAGVVAAKAELPDVILLDLIMPYASGFEVLRHLRDDPATRDIPVLVLSTQGGEDDIVRALDQGAEDFLIKPFYARELLARVRKILARPRVTRS
ncbi:MAG TPA: response regulator [Gemmatimonadales bacterium]|nr:response regulator [Gemmatimonadales bacterium]